MESRSLESYWVVEFDLSLLEAIRPEERRSKSVAWGVSLQVVTLVVDLLLLMMQVEVMQSSAAQQREAQRQVAQLREVLRPAALQRVVLQQTGIWDRQ